MLYEPSTSSLEQRPIQHHGQRKKRPLPKLPHRTPSGQFISLGPCWVSSSSNNLPPPPPSFSSHYNSSHPLISRSSSWYGDSSYTTAVCEPTTTYNNETSFGSKMKESLKMETNVPSSDYHGIHQKPYEPSSDEHNPDEFQAIDDMEDIEDRSNCTSPMDPSSPHTPQDSLQHDPALLKRYSSPLYQLSHRHSMLLSPTPSIHSTHAPQHYLQPTSFVASSSSPQPLSRMSTTRRSVSTIDLHSSASDSITPPSASSTIPSPWLDGPVYTQTPNQIEDDDHVEPPPPPPVTVTTKNEWRPSTTSLLTPLPPPPVASSRFTIASFSLTHDKDALATYRRMATKTKDQQVQMSYMMYLIQVADLYRHQKRGDLRLRLLHEAGYWLRRLAKARFAPALVIKGRWYIQQQATYSVQKGMASSLVALDDLNLMMLAQSNLTTTTNNNNNIDTTNTDLLPTAKTGSPPGFLDRHQKQQWEKAKQCFQQAAKAGSMDAHYELALLLCKKLPSGGRDEVSKIMTSLRLAADQHHLLACYKMATILLFGQFDQVPDIQDGLAYLEKTAEITQGEETHPIHAKASFMLSCIYAGDPTCLGLKQISDKAADLTKFKNLTQARYYLDKAVALRNPEALLRLGQLYGCGHPELGYMADPWQAFQWYLEAASEAHQPLAMLAVAQSYAQGIPGYLSTNPTLAFKWCQRASEQCLDQADYLLGTYYETGYGVTPDYPKALACYDKAASKGYTPAEEMLNRQPACVHRHPSTTNQTSPSSSTKEPDTNRRDKKKKDFGHPRFIMSHKSPELSNCSIM